MISIMQVRTPELTFLSGTRVPVYRIELSFPQKVFFCRAKYSESEIDGSFSLRVVPPNLVAGEKEEAKAVLTLFLKKQGLSNALAEKAINRSEPFIDHLVARLHSLHKSRYLVGHELTTLEIRDALIPYLEALHEEYGSIVVDIVESFPNPPVLEKIEESVKKVPLPVTPASPPSDVLDAKKLKALARVTDIGPTGKLPANILYLVELGMDIEKIRVITRKYPSFAYYSLEGKIRPFVKFLLDLGVPRSQIPAILTNRPQLCGISLSQNLIPTMAFLEELGVDKEQWAKVIYRFPALLTYSRLKIRATVDFLYEMGLSTESVSKVLTRCPCIVGYSVEDKLRPATEYFRSIGVDASVLLYKCPNTFGLSIEANIKPHTKFFKDEGFSMAEVAGMVSRFGALYTLSMAKLVLKWNFFLTMGYPKEELVKFPQYFSYSLEERIKPRFAIMTQKGVRLLLNNMLILSADAFNDALERKLKKLLDN